MESAFGVDHGGVSKALNPFKAFKAAQKPKVPATSQYTPPWQKATQPTKPGLRNPGDAPATPGQSYRAGGGQKTFQTSAAERNPKKKPTAYPARRPGF